MLGSFCPLIIIATHIKLTTIHKNKKYYIKNKVADLTSKDYVKYTLVKSTA